VNRLVEPGLAKSQSEGKVLFNIMKTINLLTLGVLLTTVTLTAAEAKLGMPAPALQISQWLKGGPVDLADGQDRRLIPGTFMLLEHLLETRDLLPAPISDIAYQNKAVVYDILFKTTARTLITIAADPNNALALPMPKLVVGNEKLVTPHAYIHSPDALARVHRHCLKLRLFQQHYASIVSHQK